MKATIGDWYDLTKGYLWLAGLVATFGLIFLVVELQSADLVIWTGHCVPAAFSDGLAYYRVGGQQYVVGDPTVPDFPPRRVTVCYDRAHADKGYIVHPGAYWAEGGLIGVPLAIALVIFAVGVGRAARILAQEARAQPT